MDKYIPLSDTYIRDNNNMIIGKTYRLLPEGYIFFDPDSYIYFNPDNIISYYIK